MHSSHRHRKTLDTLATMLEVIEDGLRQAEAGHDPTIAVERITVLGKACLTQQQVYTAGQ